MLLALFKQQWMGNSRTTYQSRHHYRNYTFYTAVSDATSQILGKERRRNKAHQRREVFYLSAKRHLKKKRYEVERMKEYRQQTRGLRRQCRKQKKSGQALSPRRLKLACAKQQRENKPAGKGSNPRETGQILNYLGQV